MSGLPTAADGWGDAETAGEPHTLVDNGALDEAGWRAAATGFEEGGAEEGWGYDPHAYVEGTTGGWAPEADSTAEQQYDGYEQWAETQPEGVEGADASAIVEGEAHAESIKVAAGEPAVGKDQPATAALYGREEEAASVPPSVSPEPDAAPAEGLDKLARLSKRVKEQQLRIQRMEQQAFVDGQKVFDLQEQLVKKDLEFAPTLAALEFHKKELASLKAEAAEICKGAVLNWQIRAEQAERELDEARRLLKQRDSECEALRQDVADAEAAHLRRMDRLQEELGEVRREAEMLKASVTKLEAASALVTSQVEEAGEERKRLQEELWRKQEDLLTLQRQNQELGESGLKAKFQLKLDEAERCHKRALDVVTQRMLQEVEHLKQELEQMAAEKEQLLRHQEDFRTFLKPSMRGITRPSRPEPAKPPPEVKVDAELPVKWDYLRGILLQFLQNSDPNFRRRLLPILATVLRFDHYELHAIYLANKQWVVDAEPAGCGTFFSAFLRNAAR
eukprot:GGOE01061998.1.p1 GENE.GGOE01061998.1~~GGOE01061998.1.p1  ORF type:complete len:505 (+),score=207.02 GGOE01061998.1:68-1582(+)